MPANIPNEFMFHVAAPAHEGVAGRGQAKQNSF